MELTKKINRVLLVLFLIFLFGLTAAFLLLPDADFSETENRSLRTFPKFTFEKLLSGEFSDEINEYFADQFPMRDLFVSVKADTELAMGKGESGGVLIGEGGQLATRLFDIRTSDGNIPDTDAFDPAFVRAAMAGVRQVISESDVPVTVLFTGRSVDVAASAFDYPDTFSLALRDLVAKELEDVNYLDGAAILRERYEAGEYVAYRTDHHWTTLGAYYAYCEVMRSFGMEDEILPREDFTVETASEDFYGTAWSAGGMRFVSPDRIEFWIGGDEGEYSVTADGKALDGFYARSYLDGKDQYSAFLDGTHERVEIRKTTGEARPTLLLLRDSFGSSLAPFLARHFDLVLLNLSSGRTDFSKTAQYAKDEGADRVLVVYTLENVITADQLRN